MQQEQTPLDTWAIVEVMGHQRYAGRLTEHQIAGAGMLRIDVPPVAENRPGFTKFFGPSSIFSITPTDEDTAVKAAAAFRAEPVEQWRLQPMNPYAALSPADHDELEPDDPEEPDDPDEDNCPF